MASINGVALVLAAYILFLSALSGEANVPVAEELSTAGGAPPPSPSLSSTTKPQSAGAPSIAEPPKKSSGPQLQSPEGSLIPSAASPINLNFQLPLEMPPESQTPSSLPKDQLEKLSKFLQAQLDAASDKVEKFSEEVIEKRLTDDSTNEDVKKCFETCKEVYGDALDSIHKAQEDIKGSLWFKARVDISAFSTDIVTCQDCFVEMNKEDAQVLEFEQWAQGVSSECLAKLEIIDK